MLQVDRKYGLLCTIIYFINYGTCHVVVIFGTVILMPYHPYRVIAPLLKIKSLQMKSIPKTLQQSVMIWGFCCQKQVSQAGISNYISKFTVGCNYFSLPEIPASGNKVYICQWIQMCLWSILDQEYNVIVHLWNICKYHNVHVYISVEWTFSEFQTEKILMTCSDSINKCVSVL